MFKCKMYLLNNYYLSVFIILFLTIAGCSDLKIEEDKISELKLELLENKESLNIDVNLFNSRIDEMDEMLRKFRNHYKKEIDKELGDQLSKFKVIWKIYKRKIGEYGAQIKEQEALATQINNLETDTKNGSINKDEFKKFFKQENDDVQKLRIKSREINKTLYELEPEFTRLYKVLKPISETIETTLLP